MIRTGHSVAISEEDLNRDDFFGEDFGRVSTTSSSGVCNKRKLADTQSSTILKLESLELDSEDEDVLVLDTEGDQSLLADIDPVVVEDDDDTRREVFAETFKRPSESGKTTIVLKTRNVPLPTTSNSDEEGMDQNKWLRCVVSDNGQLKCTVSNTVETLSNSGETESLMADTIKELVKTYLTKRQTIIDETGLLSTPLHVVKKLATDHGEQVHCEGTLFPNGCHRMELFSGNLRGVGEGTTMKIARQMAAIDLLEQVQLSGPGIRIPAMGLLPGWLTNPAVFRDLFAVCKQKNLPRIKIESKLNFDPESGPQPNCSKWRAVCTVGHLKAVGESEEDIFARREAAKEMYQMITNMEYKDIPFAIGRACLRLGELSGTGFQPIMSNQKKVWLLKNRVVNNQLVIRDDEEDLALYNVEELKKDLNETDLRALEPSNTKKLKVTVKNVGPLSEDDLLSEVSPSISRCVSVEPEPIYNAEVESTWPWF